MKYKPFSCHYFLWVQNKYQTLGGKVGTIGLTFSTRASTKDRKDYTCYMPLLALWVIVASMASSWPSDNSKSLDWLTKWSKCTTTFILTWRLERNILIWCISSKPGTVLPGFSNVVVNWKLCLFDLI